MRNTIGHYNFWDSSMDLFSTLMDATNSVGGNVSVYFAGKDAELLKKMHSYEDDPDMDECQECGRMETMHILDVNFGACRHCAMGRKEKIK
jgi:hypothetical protein